MHIEAYAWVAQSLQMMPTPSTVLELGSRDINGSPRPLLPGTRYTGLDVVAGDGVDVVADAAQFEALNPFDLVICCEVLEHAPQAAAIVATAVRCTAPGGHIIITCASDGRAPHSAVDGGTVREGEHYANVPWTDLQAWLQAAGATVLQIESRPDRGDVYAFARRAA
ncbi:AdoMet_MTases domain containing protein [uncultured Caudovirales phage]|uniref:AdoMet_MTases domain containing protein n=1 Tax=uncultured Caudovirales phage TaxID=2100421 RepID=A0A6J5Q7M0_9CAUD|nr:AdoMet_MTases domain containing protein [uncultured Caudovirales phage]CAB4199370.1 AdoMet_MTases domain containing protein [uncultured Caudovirales phage]CAB4212914.1 AdoMet_MTases domain containing protein [uncultured Caudovirales phage]CAB5227990.1 AdoMet_MTases domain containing protein [uncultured Caudovirales phage]